MAYFIKFRLEASVIFIFKKLTTKMEEHFKLSIVCTPDIAGCLKYWSLITSRGKIFSLLQMIQKGSGDHWASSSVRIREPFLGDIII